MEVRNARHVVCHPLLVMQQHEKKMANLQVMTLDSADVQEEVQVGSEPPPKKRHLRKKEVVALCRRLLSIERSDILTTVVAGVEADAAHFKAFPTREVLWHSIRSSALYPDFLKQLIMVYTDLYKAHHQGRDKYAHFLVAWQEFLMDLLLEAKQLQIKRGWHW